MKNSTNPKFKMNVPKTVFDQWEQRKSRGDLVNIHKATKLSRPTVNKALKNGIASPETILKISAYYSKKKSVQPKDIEAEALQILNGQP